MTKAAVRLPASLLVLVFGMASVTACASTSPAPVAREVADLVEQRSGQRPLSLQKDGELRVGESSEVRKAIDDLLAKELTADTAVQVALLANPYLRATFEELAISQADLVQAGLLKNPVFGFGRTAWEAEHISPNLFASVEQDFLDIVTMPMRKRIAKSQLEATKLEVGDAVLALAASVRKAFYTAQAAEQALAMRRLVADAADASADLARRQHDAGNKSDLALSSELALAAQARLDAMKSEGEAATEREHLNKEMGIWGPRTRWKMGVRLPELPSDEPSLEGLEKVAIAQRLDIGAARQAVRSLDQTLSLAKTTRWTGAVDVHVEAGRLRHNQRLSFGPSVLVEVPLFDRREAAIARLEALKRQAEDNLHALAIDARSDVRADVAKLVTARAIAGQYGSVIVPQRENVVKFSQEQYDAMLLGVHQLIQAKQNEFDAYRATIEALRDYWIARTDLERTIGRRLSTTSGDRR